MPPLYPMVLSVFFRVMESNDKTVAVLLEAARRVDEWPHILTKLPSPQVLLAPITTPTAWSTLVM